MAIPGGEYAATGGHRNGGNGTRLKLGGANLFGAHDVGERNRAVV